MNTKLFGKWGEEQAANYLRKKKYEIISAGYRTRFGEIDLIAKKKNTIVFVEVKLRRDDSFAETREFVTAAKQKRLIAAAEQWLAQNETELQPRFDVMEIYAPEGIETKRPRIRHWENAFGADF